MVMSVQYEMQVSQKKLHIQSDLSSDLLAQAKQATHQQLVAMQSICRKLKWTNAACARSIYVKHIASTWTWYSILIQPLDKYLDQVAVMQAVMRRTFDLERADDTLLISLTTTQLQSLLHALEVSIRQKQKYLWSLTARHHW